MANKYTQEAMIRAIEAANGMIYIAARKLGCSHQTVYNYARRYPAVQKTIDEQRGILLDTAELALLKAITQGEGWAVCFTLKTLGKQRGFVERQEITGADGGALEVKVLDVRDKLNDLISRHAPRDEAGEDTEQTE
jgi:hypothetical protein